MATDGYLDWAREEQDDSGTDTERTRMIIAQDRAEQALLTAHRAKIQRRKKKRQKTFADILNILLRSDRYATYYIAQSDVDGRITCNTPVWKQSAYGSLINDGYTIGRMHRDILLDTGKDLSDSTRYYNKMVAIMTEQGKQFVPEYGKRIVINNPSDGEHTIELPDYVYRDNLQLRTVRVPTLVMRPLLHEDTFMDAVPYRFLQVMADQRWTVETAWLYCALIGRWCYGRGHPDSWHILPYDLGVPGAGKGVMMEVKRALWPGELCADIQYGDRTDFNLGSCLSAEVCYINEAESTENQRLSIAQLNKMAAGECVDVNAKWGKKALMQFTLPLWFNGNTMIRFRADRSEDKGLVRRLVPFPFLHCMAESNRANANIAEEIKQNELSSVFVFCTLVYDALRNDIGNAMFPLSAQMKRFHKTQLSSVDPLIWFFRCCVQSTALSDDENWITLDALQERYTQFLYFFDLHAKRTRITPDTLTTKLLNSVGEAITLGVRNDTDVVLHAIWKNHGEGWTHALSMSNHLKFQSEMLLSEAEEASVYPLRILGWFHDAWEQTFQHNE